MEVQQILSKMESEGWEISDDFKTAHGHFLQYFLETIEEALRQPPVSGECEHPYHAVLGDGEMQPPKCLKCGKVLI